MVRQGAAVLTDVALDIYLSGKILNAFVKLGKIGLAQRAETVPLLKKFRPRRTASFHPAQGDELCITAEKAAKILVDNKPYSPAAEVVELTSHALIENSCNAELVIRPGKPTSLAVVPPVHKNPIAPAIKVPVDNALFSNLKSMGENIWQSPGGVIYGDDKKFGNRVYHVLSHGMTDLGKKSHSVFNLPKEKILELIDEAWFIKASPSQLDPGAYIVDMKKIIGTNGETIIKLIVKPGTNEIITAYPIK